MMKKILSTFFILNLFCLNCTAELIVDDSVHEQISKKYELEKLPNLPSNISNEEDIFTPNEFDAEPSSKYTPQNSQPQNQQLPQKTQEPKTTQKIDTQPSTPQKTYVYDNSESIKIRKGKKFKVTNTSVLSDNLKKGSKVTFITQETETDRYITIPKNTVFKGVVVDSHKPNLSANGGLLVIKVNSMIYKGKNFPVNAKITLANQKHIFFNNIKGQHKFWQNAAKSTQKGKKIYDRMWAKTKKYFKPGIEIILTPITFLTGTVAFGANIVASPVLALFSKGGRLIIPKDSNFVIKMLDDAIIYK